jgi:hypothetical protein
MRVPICTHSGSDSTTGEKWRITPKGLRSLL